MVVLFHKLGNIVAYLNKMVHHHLTSTVICLSPSYLSLAWTIDKMVRRFPKPPMTMMRMMLMMAGIECFLIVFGWQWSRPCPFSASDVQFRADLHWKTELKLCSVLLWGDLSCSIIFGDGRSSTFSIFVSLASTIVALHMISSGFIFVVNINRTLKIKVLFTIMITA